MNATDRQFLRLSILTALEPVGQRGLSAVALARHCAGSGFALSETELASELLWLADKGLLGWSTSSLSPGLRRYWLRERGRECLDNEGVL